MKTKTDGHLSDRDLAAAVADPSRLSGEAREHLESCPACAGEVERFSARLEGLGRMAREHAPGSVNRFRFASPEPALRSFFLRPPALAGGGLLALALVALWGLNILSPEGSREELRPARNGQAELSSVEARLEEAHPLSPFHSFIIGQDTVTLNDDFMEFVSNPSESI